MSFSRRVLPCIVGFAVATASLPVLAIGAERYNVLMIAVDDLRPQLGCYGDPVVQTPHLDRLASSGLVLQRAYCQQAVCSPSRTSLLTGMRPDSTRVYDLLTHFRKFLPDHVTLPQHFKNHGYHAQSLGKVYHNGLDDPQSWSVASWMPSGPSWQLPENQALVRQRTEQLQLGTPANQQRVVERDPATGLALKVQRPRGRAYGPPVEAPDIDDSQLNDGKTARKAVEVLKQVKDRPFFLAVGFVKPHLPFIAPKKYFDLYPPESIRLAANPYPPRDVPPQALTSFGELRSYYGMPQQGPLSDKQARELIRGYYAATTFVDAQIGFVLDALDELNLADNTVVVVWGDHGWQLGEHGLWCKHTNFELACRAPLIVRVPGQKSAGSQSAALVEFVDIFPTLCEVCRLPVPDDLEGTSFAPLVESPQQGWKSAAFSQYPRGDVMGYSVRTDRFRYTEWRNKQSETVGVELYDHESDPDENVNVAAHAPYASHVEQLRTTLAAGWRQARP